MDMEKRERTYKIGEAAKMLGVNTCVLRFWEEEFSQLKPERTQKGQRRYSREDMTTLNRIRGLLYERGMTIEGAKKVLEGRPLPRARRAEQQASSAVIAEKEQPENLAMPGRSEVVQGTSLLQDTLQALAEVRKMLAGPVTARPERREPEKRQLSLLNMTGGRA